MPLTKKQKEAILKDLSEKFGKQTSLVITGFSKLSVEKLRELRRSLKEKGAEYKITKKTIWKIVFDKAGIKFPDMKGKEGSIGVAFSSDDLLASANIAHAFSKLEGAESFNILGGVLDNEIIGSDAMINLAKIGSRDNLMSGFLRQLNAPVSRLVYVLKAISEKSN